MIKILYCQFTPFLNEWGNEYFIVNTKVSFGANFTRL